MSYNYFPKTNYLLFVLFPFTDSLIQSCWAAQGTKLRNSIPKILGETKAFTGQGSTFWRKQNSIRSSVEPSISLDSALVIQQFREGRERAAPFLLPPTTLLHKEMLITDSKGKKTTPLMNSFIAKYFTFLLAWSRRLVVSSFWTNY